VAFRRRAAALSSRRFRDQSARETEIWNGRILFGRIRFFRWRPLRACISSADSQLLHGSTGAFRTVGGVVTAFGMGALALFRRRGRIGRNGQHTANAGVLIFRRALPTSTTSAAALHIAARRARVEEETGLTAADYRAVPIGIASFRAALARIGAECRATSDELPSGSGQSRRQEQPELSAISAGARYPGDFHRLDAAFVDGRFIEQHSPDDGCLLENPSLRVAQARKQRA